MAIQIKRKEAEKEIGREAAPQIIPWTKQWRIVRIHIKKVSWFNGKKEFYSQLQHVLLSAIEYFTIY